MKKLTINLVFLILTCLTWVSCDKTVDEPITCELQGRWIYDDFPNTMIEFTDSLQYTIYSVDGKFGTRQDAIPNPHTYWFEGDSLVTDLNFGNKSSCKPYFKCNCMVLELHGPFAIAKMHKEGFDPATCQWGENWYCRQEFLAALRVPGRPFQRIFIATHWERGILFSLASIWIRASAA